MLAPGDTLHLYGSGFINNYPQGHIIYLRDQDQKISKIQAFYSNASELVARIPNNLSYGDYQIAVKLQTKWLESRVNKATKPTYIRPKAPLVTNNESYVYKNLEELNSELSNTDNAGHALVYQLLNPLSVGENKLNAHYYDNNYLSLASAEITVMILPETAINPVLELESTKVMVRRKLSPNSLELKLPTKIFSYEEELKNNASERLSRLNLSNAPLLIDVSAYSHNSNGDYSQEIYLDSPTNPHYLSTKAFKSPIKIQKIHVKSPESLLLYNHSSKTFPLASCGLSDNIMTRHTFFEPSSIAAGDPFLYTGDLGLNDTGGDSLSLDCPCNHPIIQEASIVSQEQGFTMPVCTNNKMRLDSFSYESLDLNGYAMQ